MTNLVFSEENTQAGITKFYMALLALVIFAAVFFVGANLLVWFAFAFLDP